MKAQKIYACIDLKSFYASVECADRGLDPFTDRLVVADPERTSKTICLAITPSMKDLGIKNRCRVFEIPHSISYIMAKPRMRRYMEVSADIYQIYLSFVSAEDIHIYSIDECFIDITAYLKFYNTDARGFVKMLMGAVFEKTHICATAGIGTNLFLAKVALDVTAKHSPGNISFLDKASFQREIWFHQPITDIWNIGPGIARRLSKYGVHDLAGIAAMHKETLFKEFGVNAEYLIDHAWGQEPCTIADIQAYKPSAHSITNGQVLPCAYSFEEARMVISEMIDESVLELIELGLVSDHISLYIDYARDKNAHESSGNAQNALFEGGHGKRRVHARSAYKHTGGSRKLGGRSNSRKFLRDHFLQLFDETTLRNAPVHRINISFGNLLPEQYASTSLFDDQEAEAKEHNLQKALVTLRGKYGKNSLLKGISLKEKATARERNEQIGGHHA